MYYETICIIFHFIIALGTATADESALTNWLMMNGGLHSADLDEIE